MTGAPPLTVLMPVYDAAPYLRQAIESVLSQSFRDFELVIVEDGSSDGSRQILGAYDDPRIRLLQHPRNQGLTKSLNEGLALARGELVARQDADDISHPRRLELQVGFLRRNPEVALLGTQARMIDEAGRSLGPLEKACEDAALRWELLFENGFVHSAVMFRKRAVFEELGGYDETYRYCQDAELWSRLMRSQRAANLEETLVDNRVHLRSMTLTSLDANRSESRRVIGDNLRAEFGPALSERDIALALDLREGLAAGAAPPFFALFERMLELFRGRHPEVRGSRDFRRAVARQYARLWMAARRESPRLTARILSKSLRGYPVLGCTLRAGLAALRARRKARRRS